MPRSSSLLAAVVLGALALMAALAPWLAPYDPLLASGAPLSPPGPGHVLGTNDIGQDIWSAWLWGGRASLLVGLLVALVSTVLAWSVGMLAALWRSGSGLVLALTDLLLALPAIPLLLLVVALLGPSQIHLVLVLGLLSWPAYARVVRSRVLGVAGEPYVEAARAVGGSPLRVALRHIAPATLGLLPAKLALTVRFALFAEATLAFLGLGDPAARSWGTMLGTAFNDPLVFATSAWAWWVLPPALAIVGAVVSVTCLTPGDRATAARRATDPPAGAGRSTIAGMFEGFRLETIDTGEASLRVRHGGSGPPLLLLHGHPQTHAMWHAVAPRLADEFTVVAPDLRGYGASSKPPTAPDHEPYSKRAMARDLVALMAGLGFDRFSLAGHDRGGRVAYRLALDYPLRVSRLAVLDILPTGEHFRRTDMEFALGYWHWFFLAQPFDTPERMIGADPHAFFTRDWARDANGSAVPPAYFAPEAVADYLQCYANPATVHAACEDYRAGATFDYALDEADRAADQRIACPVLSLWGARGQLPRWYDVLAIWRDWANDVRGHAIDSGHYLAEEAPDDTYAALRAFFAAP